MEGRKREAESGRGTDGDRDVNGDKTVTEAGRRRLLAFCVCIVHVCACFAFCMRRVRGRLACSAVLTCAADVKQNQLDVLMGRSSSSGGGSASSAGAAAAVAAAAPAAVAARHPCASSEASL